MCNWNYQDFCPSGFHSNFKPLDVKLYHIDHLFLNLIALLVSNLNHTFIRYKEQAFASNSASVKHGLDKMDNKH